jgi:CheY-specific phosphatase CheX
MMNLTAELVASVEGLLGEVLGARISLAPGTMRSTDVCSCVHILGGYSGVLVATAGHGFARTVATVLLECPEDALTESDTVDAMAELANILAGNVKGMFEVPSFLTVPTVSRAPIELPGAKSTARCTFADSRGGTLRVELFSNTARDSIPDLE